MLNHADVRFAADAMHVKRYTDQPIGQPEAAMLKIAAQKEKMKKDREPVVKQTAAAASPKKATKKKKKK